MSKLLKWALISSIFIVAACLCVYWAWFPVSGEIQDPLCPTAFAAVEDRFVKVPSVLDSFDDRNYSFVEFCILVTPEHPNLEALYRDVELDEEDEYVKVILFAYFEGLPEPVRTELDLRTPFLGQFDFFSSEPRFGDQEIVLPVEKDWDQVYRAIVATVVGAVGLILIVFYSSQIWEVLSSS